MQIDTAHHCLRTVVSALRDILDDDEVRVWQNKAGKSWQTFDEIHQTLADDMDLELWGDLLGQEQLDSYRVVLRRLDEFYGAHKLFDAEAASSRSFEALRAAAREFLTAASGLISESMPSPGGNTTTS